MSFKTIQLDISVRNLTRQDNPPFGLLRPRGGSTGKATMAMAIALFAVILGARHLDLLISMHSLVSKIGLRFSLILNGDVSKLANRVALMLDYTKA